MSTQSGGVCRRCHTSDWRVFGLSQPILAVSCQTCGGVEWIGFLPEEWAKFVSPLTVGGKTA